MRIIYSDEASEDLDGILAYIASNYSTVYEAFLIRLRSSPRASVQLLFPLR
jgi:plasmid stabilization system protein ParE